MPGVRNRASLPGLHMVWRAKNSKIHKWLHSWMLSRIYGTLSVQEKKKGKARSNYNFPQISQKQNENRKKDKRSGSRWLCKIDHLQACVYVIQNFLQGMGHMCSGYLDIAGDGHVHSPWRPGWQTLTSSNPYGLPPERISQRTSFVVYWAGLFGLCMAFKWFSCLWTRVCLCAGKWIDVLERPLFTSENRDKYWEIMILRQGWGLARRWGRRMF